MRQDNVVILDDVIDSGKHSAGVDRHVSSIASTGEASREQGLSDYYRGDAVTSAGAITPDSDTVETARQDLVSVPPPVTTCNAQPRSVTPVPIRQNTTLQATVAFYQRSLQAPARS